MPDCGGSTVDFLMEVWHRRMYLSTKFPGDTTLQIRGHTVSTTGLEVRI